MSAVAEPSKGTEVRTPSTPADLLLITSVSLWALSYSVVKFGLREIEPLAFPVILYGIAGTILLVILFLREGSVGVRRDDFPLLGLVGLLAITLGQASYVFALANTSASDTALLGATAPIMTTVMAAVVGLERMGRRHWVAACVAFAGVTLIVAGGTSMRYVESTLLGDAAALASALVSSSSTLPIVPLLRRYSAHRILTYEMLIGTLLMLPFATPGLLRQNYAAVTPAGWAALGYTIALSGIVSNLLYFVAIGRVGPSRAALYQYLQSFLAVLFAVMLLGEHISIIQLFGGMTVVVGVILGRSGIGRGPAAPHAVPDSRLPA